MAPLPSATAEAISPSSSFLSPRAVRRIQKIIQVTRPAARIDMVPPTPSCALNDSCSNAIVMNVNTAMTSASAASDADPDVTDLVPPLGLDQIGDQDADDQAGFEALAETDQEVGEHLSIVT